VLWEGIELGVGEGSSKKQAETAAALAALHAHRWEEQAAFQPPGAAGVDSENP
jgi:dsRNA-specific ribonuclease